MVTNMYYVYILLNEAKTRTYTGVAEDVIKRLALHNARSEKPSIAMNGGLWPMMSYPLSPTRPMFKIRSKRCVNGIRSLAKGGDKLSPPSC